MRDTGIELKQFGVRSKTLRIDGVKAKGYRVDGDDGLAQAWARYLPAHIPVTPVASQLEDGERATDSENTRGTRGTTRGTRGTPVAPKTALELDLFGNATAATGIPPGTDSAVEAASAFVPPTGPGRCPECGWHIATQGHRPDCPGNEWA